MKKPFLIIAIALVLSVIPMYSFAVKGETLHSWKWYPYIDPEQEIISQDNPENSSDNPPNNQSNEDQQPSGENETNVPNNDANMPKGDLPGWKQVFSDDFEGVTLPKGSFKDCKEEGCQGLPEPTQSNWGAYPNTYDDTAGLCNKGSNRCPTGQKYKFGGVYDPEKTVSIVKENGDGVMKIDMFNDGQKNHVAAMIPKKMAGKKYGRYAIRFKTTKTPGYKLAWLLWADNEEKCKGCEIDFPELELDKKIAGFVHPKGGGQQDSYETGASFDQWHTAVTEWTPGKIKFYLDGKEVKQSGSGKTESTNNIPDEPMSWIIQSESSLDPSSVAEPNSKATIWISWVAGWEYEGKQ
ncbi:Glycosyl hydrolases family 16 [Seinonella peptonophila]|uniref:Glycosyl hydrolases family 16 n=1 Tax=Seinonella peptonophila TaxID=112248 RepID=A0A1M4X4K9_9BACL|nr:glycoside hydrolase family 16 protein [Seinonella peptonophila]SHE88395.1 Glycosyl hydrolases family 16 [Seinonella peptonophila]